MAHVLTISRTSERTEHAGVADLAASLGLRVQAERYSKPYDITRDFTAMTPDELRVWDYFCPTAYRAEWTEPNSVTIDEGQFYGREYRWPLSEYRHDTLPPEVLRHWGDVKNRYAFDAFEVRTTERRSVPHPDPLLIGYFSGAAYLLARWGLESPEALPLREVALKVKADIEKEAPYSSSTFLWSTTHYHPYKRSRTWQAACRLLGITFDMTGAMSRSYAYD